jgi:hypothetical protein
MAQIEHDVSFPNDGLGDELRTAFINQNTMNEELYDTKVDKVTGKGLSANDFTDILKTKLENLDSNGEENVQADWNQTDNSQDDYIKNKPTIDQYASVIGFFDYRDSGDTVAYTAEDIENLQNDKAGDGTDISHPPYGVSDLWDIPNSQLQFDGLEVGDLIKLRIDTNVTLTDPDSFFELGLKLATGAIDETNVKIARETTQASSYADYSHFYSFYLATESQVTEKGKIYFYSPSNGEIIVKGFFIEVVRRGVNITEIQLAGGIGSQDLQSVLGYGGRNVEPYDTAATDFTFDQAGKHTNAMFLGAFDGDILLDDDTFEPGDEVRFLNLTANDLDLQINVGQTSIIIYDGVAYEAEDVISIPAQSYCNLITKEANEFILCIININNTNEIPTLEQILNNNHDLTNGRNFQGTNSGYLNTGNRVNGFGTGSLNQNSGNDVNAFGNTSAVSNTGNNINALGIDALTNNSADNANAFGEESGYGNVYKNVNLFGYKATADADNQTVFSKWVTGVTKYLARLSFNNITADRKWELQDVDGTIAHLSDIRSAWEYHNANFDAENGKFYSTLGTVTITDPLPNSPNSGYVVYVVGGTTTIGGVNYTAGALVYRFYSTVVWTSVNVNSIGGIVDYVEAYNGIQLAVVNNFRTMYNY